MSNELQENARSAAMHRPARPSGVPRDGTDTFQERDESLCLEGRARDDEHWILRLYVAGQTPRSLLAVANLRRICSVQLRGRYQLEVIDLYQQPQLAQGEQIVAVPALIRRLPAPLRMLIGDMSDTERIVIGLDLQPK